MISNTVARWIYFLEEDYIDPDSGKLDDLPLRQLQFATKMDFGTDQDAWRRWFEENDFYTAYQGWLTPMVIRCLHALEGKLDPDSPDYLTLEEARHQLFLRMGRDLGDGVQQWKQWIVEEGIEAYDGSFAGKIGPLLRLMLSGKRQPGGNTVLPKTPEEAHEVLVEDSEEDFGYDIRAWFEWFIENEDEVAFKGRKRRRLPVPPMPDPDESRQPSPAPKGWLQRVRDYFIQTRGDQ